jgi:hypothetical protein
VEIKRRFKISFSGTTMPPKRTTVASATIDTPARDHFYRLVWNHIDSLNVKVREKAVITSSLSEKITEALQNKPSHEKKAGLFLRWCRQSFILRPIGGHQVLCDIKNVEPVLLFEDIHEVSQDSHQQTAHSGRDKCQEYISANYSWTNRTLLQIFIAQCSACHTRKSIKLQSVTKPTIALGISDHALQMIFCFISHASIQDESGIEGVVNHLRT